MSFDKPRSTGDGDPDRQGREEPQPFNPDLSKPMPDWMRGDDRPRRPAFNPAHPTPDWARPDREPSRPFNPDLSKPMPDWMKDTPRERDAPWDDGPGRDNTPAPDARHVTPAGLYREEYRERAHRATLDDLGEPEPGGEAWEWAWDQTERRGQAGSAELTRETGDAVDADEGAPAMSDADTVRASCSGAAEAEACTGKMEALKDKLAAERDTYSEDSEWAEVDNPAPEADDPPTRRDTPETADAPETTDRNAERAEWLEQRVEKLEQRAERKDQHIEKLEERNDRLEAKNDKLEAENERLKAELAEKNDTAPGQPADKQTSVDQSPLNIPAEDIAARDATPDRPWYKKFPSEKLIGLGTTAVGLGEAVVASTGHLSSSQEGIITAAVGLGVSALGYAHEKYQERKATNADRPED